MELLLRISNRQLIPRQQRLLLCLDGLNEAVTEGSDNPLPRFLPQALPPGVFFLASIRAGHPYLSFFAERSYRSIAGRRRLGGAAAADGAGRSVRRARGVTAAATRGHCWGHAADE